MKRREGLFALVLIAVVFPVIIPHEFYIKVATQALCWSILAVSLNYLVGLCGLVSLAHAALAGVAGYAAALMLGTGHGPLISSFVAIISCVAASAAIGLLATGAVGVVFMMITLTSGQILWALAHRWVTVTNGENGISLARRPVLFGFDMNNTETFYYVVVFAFLSCWLAYGVLARSPLGFTITGTRDQPRRMRALGYDVDMLRLVACMLSGFWAGVAGLLLFFYNQFVSPHSMSLVVSSEVVLMLIAGGASSSAGPLVGAALVVAVKVLVSSYVQRWSAILGGIFVVIVLFLPGGIVPGLISMRDKLFSRMRKCHQKAKMT
jgi:branched-chain amino acid transport system permease protein